MKRQIVLSLILLFGLSIRGVTQERKFPRDISKLYTRAQEFWRLLGSDQRLKAIDFVTPEKRERMVSAPRLPFKDARVLGIDFADDPDQAFIRVNLKVMVQDVQTGFQDSTITDHWVWIKNNWFLDLTEPPLRSMFNAPSLTMNTVPAAALTAALEKTFTVSDSVIDLGVIPEGELRNFAVHVTYTGDHPAFLKIGFPVEAIMINKVPNPLTASLKEIPIAFDSNLWQGDFSIPVTLIATDQGASVERTVIVRGSVFVPLAVNQGEVFLDGPNAQVHINIRNNTDNAIRLLSITSDGAFADVLEPKQIPAKSEVSVELQRKNTERKPDKLSIRFEPAINGKATILFPLRIRTPY